MALRPLQLYQPAHGTSEQAADNPQQSCCKQACVGLYGSPSGRLYSSTASTGSTAGETKERVSSKQSLSKPFFSRTWGLRRMRELIEISSGGRLYGSTASTALRLHQPLGTASKRAADSRWGHTPIEVVEAATPHHQKYYRKRQSEHAHYILYMFSSELLFGLPLTRSLLSPQTITLSVSFDQHCFCNDACFSIEVVEAATPHHQKYYRRAAKRARSLHSLYVLIRIVFRIAACRSLAPSSRSLLSPQTTTLSVSFDQHCFCNDACFSTAPSLYLRRKILVSQNKHWCVQIVVCAHPSLHPAAGRQRAEWTHLAHAVRSRRSGFENCCLLLARSLVSPAVEPVEAVEL